MTELSDYLLSLGVSPLLAGLVIGLVAGWLARGTLAGGRSRPSQAVTAFAQPAPGGGDQVTVVAAGATRQIDVSRSAAILQAIEGRRKIDAIKLLREATGLGLKDARDAVEAVQDARSKRAG